MSTAVKKSKVQKKTATSPLGVLAEYRATMSALDRVQAIIEFSLDGTILHANENFLKTLGYAAEEVVGKHHSMFCTREFASSLEYKRLWANLGRGQYEAAEYLRLTKSGREIWINASYNPILNEDSVPYKVVKFASDITEQKTKALESNAKIDAISKAQAVIEFNLDGSIITANENFLKTLGYEMGEIAGRHHRISAMRTMRIRLNTAFSGRSSTAVSSMPANTSASVKVDVLCGSTRPTIQSLMRAVSPTKL